MTNKTERIKDKLYTLSKYLGQKTSSTYNPSIQDEELDKILLDLETLVDKLDIKPIEKEKNEEKKDKESFDKIKFERNLDQMLEGIQIISFDWEYLYVNDSLASKSYYYKEALLGHTMMEMYPGIEKTAMFQVLKICMDKRVTQHIENEFTYPDNSKAWFELSIQPIPEGIFVLSIDITERKNAEEKLKISEEKYRILIEEASDGIFISDEEGAYIDVNISACNMLGYTKEELLSKTTIDILLPEDAKNNPPRIDELKQGKTILSTRNLRKKDGSVLPVEITAKMLTNGNLLGMVRDITERKITEEKLLSSEKRFRQSLDNLLEGVQIHDFDWRYTYVNDSLVKYSQYTREELIGFSVMEKYPGIEQTALFLVMNKCMIERSTEHLETEFVFPNGVVAYYQLSIQPVDEGIFILSIDITERKKAEESVKKLNDELELKVLERTAQLESHILRIKESEERFQKAFQTSAAGMAITRLSDTSYLDVNDAFLQMVGYRKEEIIGHTSKELGLVVNIKQREDILEEIRNNGSAKHFELTIRHKSGRTLEVLSSAETIFMGGENYAINIIFDITERKIAEEKLKKSDTLFSSLFDLNPAALAISRIKDAKIINVNDSFLQQFGFSSKDEIIGKTSKELNVFEYQGDRETAVPFFKIGDKILDIEGKATPKNSEPKWLSTSIIVIELDNEPCILAVTLDISERKKAEEQLKAVNRELEAFTYSVSHDLRAPLRAISGYAEMLREDYGKVLDEEGKRIIQVIKSNASKMGTLIDELLAFSRLGRKEVKKESVDMNILITSVINELLKTTPHKTQITLGNLPTIMADKSLLNQVLYNLLSNAVKYTSKRQKPSIEITAEDKNNEIIFTIKDNGAGFDMLYVDKLFGVFQRLHSQEEFEGTGVGLAIVQRIIAKHGGKVWAEGQVNKGASFYFSLPIN